MKTYLHFPTDYAKMLKPRFRVGDLDLPKRRKRYSSSRKEEGVAQSTCPCGTTKESRIHVVGEREIYEKERYASEEEIMVFDVCGMEEFGRLDSSEKTIDIPRDR